MEPSGAEPVAAALVEVEGPEHPSPARADRWPPVVVRRDRIEATVDRILGATRADAGPRRARFVHPQAPAPGRGLAPGTRVGIEALRPGEVAVPAQCNSTSFAFHIAGRFSATVDDTTFDVGPRDVVAVPPMAVQRLAAVGDEPAVRLTFSNAALLEMLGVHHVTPLARLVSDATLEPLAEPQPVDRPSTDEPSTDAVHELSPGGPFGLEYERLVDPPCRARSGWHWPWEVVASHLEGVAGLDDRYRGRRVCVLYDPATTVHQGTTTTLLASMCVRPAGIVDRPHRHVAAAVNYFIEGSGWSTIGGQHVEWAAGDLLLAAPGWTVHHHASGDRDVIQMAVQDNPLHLAVGSQLWQEAVDGPVRALGSEPGFATNRSAVEDAGRH